MKYSRVIWDWNGTLLNDSWLSVEVLDTMLEKRKLPKITLQEYKDTFHFPVIDFYKGLKFDFDKESFELIGKEFIDIYNSNRQRCTLHEGASELIIKLNKCGIKQSILSAYEQNYLRQIVSNFPIKDYLEAVVGLDNIYAGTKVELGKKYYNTLKDDPRQILFVGDTEHDSDVAKAIGCDCVYLSEGHYSSKRLSCKGIPVFKNMFELGDYIFG